MLTRFIDFETDAEYQICHLKGPTEFRTRHVRKGGKSVTLVKGDGQRRTVKFPEPWQFIGGKSPTRLTPNSSALLTLTCTGRTKATVFAAWAVKR